MSETRKMNYVALTVVGAISATVALLVVNRVFHSDGEASVEAALVDACKQYNKTLPLMLDSEMRADTMVPEPLNAIVYHYTFVKQKKGELDARSIVEKIRPRVVNGYKTDASMKTLREAGVTLKYRYYDKDGSFVTEIVVKASDLN
jgi:hypothetical protein